MPATLPGMPSSAREVAAAVIAQDVQRHGVGDRVGKVTPRLGWLVPAVALLVLLGGGLGYGLAQAQVGPFGHEMKAGTAVADVALSVGPITATFQRPTTTYQVTATSLAGKPLTYVWSNTNPCGTFAFVGASATWFHPHLTAPGSNAPLPGSCSEEHFHPGTIFVAVSDGRYVCTAMYPGGSAAGTGPQPAPCEARS